MGTSQWSGRPTSPRRSSLRWRGAHLRSSAGAHAQALEADFIHRFGIPGPLDEAMTRVREIRDTGVGFLRIIPGSRDMPPGIGAESMQGVAEVRAAIKGGASA